MSNLLMEIYNQSTGVQLTLAWANEEEYQLGKRFITDIGGRFFPSPGAAPTKPEGVYLENTEQLEALYVFRRSLREKTK
jgi:hypothetical protein